jgi:hypothetical protein
MPVAARGPAASSAASASSAMSSLVLVIARVCYISCCKKRSNSGNVTSRFELEVGRTNKTAAKKLHGRAEPSKKPTKRKYVGGFLCIASI